MSVTLRRLVEMSELSLRVQVGDEAGDAARRRLDTPIDWVHSSNLTDPARFLSPRQLLLTDGAQFSVTERERLVPYVQRLADGDLVGLGFGTGLSWPTVPRELAEVCSDAELPLIEVPYQVPFLAIIRTVADLLDRERQARIRWALDAQRAISRAALRDARLQDLLAELTRQLDCGAALFDQSGRLLGSVRQQSLTPGQLEQVGDIVQMLAHRSTRSAAHISAAGNDFIVQTIGTPPRLSGLLVLSGVGTLDGVQLDVVQSVLALASISLEFTRKIGHHDRLLNGGLIRMAASGELALADGLARRISGLSIPQPTCTVFVLPDPGQHVVDRLDRLAAADSVFWGLEDGRCLVLATPEAGEEIISLCDRTEVAGGVSSSGETRRVGDLLHEATTMAETSEPGTLGRFERALRAGWPALVRGSALESVARGLLEPLDSRSPLEGAQLRETLAVWLECNGQWEPAAQRLGVHRHTVRHRVERAGELLRLDLDTFEARTRVWLALSIRSKGQGSAQSARPR